MRWWGQGLAGARPRLPARLVERPDVLAATVRALGGRERLVALAGIGGAGKSILARQACADRQVRRAFRDGIIWLEAGPGKDPIALLADLADGLALPGTAAAFGTEEQGRDHLATALRSRRVLIAVDNVRDPRQLDVLTGLAPSCTVLFTTRLAGLGTSVKASEVLVGELARDQALELLGRWTDQAPQALPAAAQALCGRVDCLALGVAMAGAMVAQGGSFADVMASVQQDPAPAGADLDAAYRYRTLFGVIEASIAGLPEADQRRYAQLAVFARCGPFPRDAVQALWQPELPDPKLDDLLAQLTGRYLLTAVGDGWFTTHDLHYDVLETHLGGDGLTAAHARLLDGYRRRYPRGLADSVTDPYLARTLAGHLHDAQLDDDLRALLTDAAWIQARLAHGQLPGLVCDYDLAGDPLTRQILRALRLAAPALAADPMQVRGQLAGRLSGHPDPGIAAWAAGLTRQASGPGPWLTPLIPAPAASPLEQVLTGHTDPVRAVAITPDGSRAVSGGEDGSMRVWDLATGRALATLTGHTDWVRAVAITPDGSRAVSGGDDGSLRVWDLATGREQATLTGHTLPVWSVAITPDGSRAASASGDGSVRVWDLATGRAQATLTGHTGEVFSLAVTPDGNLAVSGSSDGSLRVWDLTTGREQAALTGHTGWVWSVAITPDGTLAVSGGEDGSLRIWDLTTGREQATLTGGTRQVFSVAVTPEGSRAISGSSDGSVRVWDLAASRARAARSGWVFSVAMTPDGSRAVSGSSDRSLRVWDLATGREQATLTGHTCPVWSVAITPDGTLAVSGSSDGTLRVWDLATGRERAALTGHAGQVFSVAVTPDGSRAVSGSGSELRVWDLATGRERAALTGHAGQVFSVAVTPDGSRAVSGGEDASVRVWNLASGAEVARWVGDYPIIGCTALPGRPFRIGVGQGQGPPCLLEFRMSGWAAGDTPAGSDERGSQPRAGVR